MGAVTAFVGVVEMRNRIEFKTGIVRQTWLPLVLLLRMVSMTVALSLCGGV